MRGTYLALGVVIALVVVYFHGKTRKNVVATPLQGTRIDLNPALYSYPGVSSVPA